MLQVFAVTEGGLNGQISSQTVSVEAKREFMFYYRIV